MRRQWVIIALIICSTLSAAAQEGFAKFYEAAKKGDAKAQNEIGLCYDQGVGVAKDAQQAFLWYSKSAAQNYPTAQYNVGVCYYYGRGVALSYEDAVSWYRKAANQGSEIAIENIRSMNR
jgi:TPR repeat protein